jgi:hypothetical protein
MVGRLSEVRHHLRVAPCLQERRPDDLLKSVSVQVLATRKAKEDSMFCCGDGS